VPIVSIIMPAYNCELTIEKSITSILVQTFRDFELIIVNDASTDNTALKISGFNDRRIVYIDQKINTKKIGAINYAFNIAKGEYITFVDADDEIHTRKLEIQLSHFASDINLGSCFTGYTIGNITIDNKKWRVKYEQLKEEFNFEKKDINYHNTVCATVMFKKDFLLKNKGYSEYFSGKVGEDFEFCHRLVNYKKAITIPQLLYNYNTNNTESITNLAKSNGDLYFDFVFLEDLIKHRNRYNEDPLTFDKFKLMSFELKSAKRTIVILSKEINQIHFQYKNSKTYKLGSFILRNFKFFKI
jgi:glycosyltransferase involved in cell wall biosynthesis